MTLQRNPLVSQSKSSSLGELSIFTKTTGDIDEIVLKVESLIRETLRTVDLDLALMKLEQSAEATKLGTQRSRRTFWRIYRLPTSRDKVTTSGE